MGRKHVLYADSGTSFAIALAKGSFFQLSVQVVVESADS
jgi:hypothetical protein